MQFKLLNSTNAILIWKPICIPGLEHGDMPSQTLWLMLRALDADRLVP